MKRRIIALCALMALLCAGHHAHAEIVSQIVAIVNDDIITTLDLDKEYQMMAREAGKREPFSAAEKAKLRKTAIDRLVDRKLVDQKIKELNVRVAEEEVRQSIEEVKKQNNLTQERLVAALAGQGLSFDQYKDQIREQMERIRLMSQEVRSKIQVSLKEVMEYYQANRRQFGEQELYKARDILFKLPKDVTEADIAKVHARADEVFQLLKKGQSFADLAKKYSDDPNAAADGGELGTFKKGDLVPEMEDVVLKLKPGEVSDLVSIGGSFHIIKLEKKFLGDIKPFDQVKSEIEDILYKKKSEERFEHWVAELRKSAAIEIK